MAEHAKNPFFPDNVQFWYETKRAFGASSYGASEFGEVMATANRITSGDNDSWYNEWNATAERVFGEAEAQLAAGHCISARDSYLRATTYFRASEFFLHTNPEDSRIYSAYKKSIQSYKSCCALYDPPIVSVEIPYVNTTLPGYFHRVDESDTKRPLFVMHSGSTAPLKNCMAKAHALVSSAAITSLPSMALASMVPSIVSGYPSGPIGRKLLLQSLISRSSLLASILTRSHSWA